MDHEEPSVVELDSNDLERHAMFVGAEEEDQVLLGGIGRIERVGAVLDDEPGALRIDPVTAARLSEADRGTYLIVSDTLSECPRQIDGEFRDGRPPATYRRRYP